MGAVRSCDNCVGRGKKKEGLRDQCSFREGEL